MSMVIKISRLLQHEWAAEPALCQTGANGGLQLPYRVP